MKNFQQARKNQFGQTVGIPAVGLQQNMQPQILRGNYVCLLPFTTEALDSDAIAQLWNCVDTEPDSSCWTYLSYPPMASAESLKADLLRSFGFQNSIHYLIKANGQALGWAALLNIQPAHGVAEIGNLYFSHCMKQSKAATETIYLLLDACFQAGCRRVEWKCDDLNAPSKRAAQRFGFQYEGLFRQHYVVKGRSRNTAWFSILDEEWPALSQAFQAWLNAENFDPNGQQKVRLQDFRQLYQQHKTADLSLNP